MAPHSFFLPRTLVTTATQCQVQPVWIHTLYVPLSGLPQTPPTHHPRCLVTSVTPTLVSPVVHLVRLFTIGYQHHQTLLLYTQWDRLCYIGPAHIRSIG